MLPEFRKRKNGDSPSYADRYEIFCRKLVQEQLYDAAALMLSPSLQGEKDGEFMDRSDITSIWMLLSKLAAHAGIESTLRGLPK